MADKSDVPTSKGRTRKRKLVSDLEMFQPMEESAHSIAKKPKKGKVVKNPNKRTSVGRKGGKFHRKKVAPPPPRKINICELPYLVIHEILELLPVDDLENLSSTNQFFYNWICSENTPSADIPFKEDDIKKMGETRMIEKKPLLKLRCKDSISIDVFADDPFQSTYFMDLHTIYIDFSKLRELDLIPSTGKDSTKDQVRSHNVFNEMLLKTITRNGTLSQLEKFDILVDEHGQSSLSFLSSMHKLRDFGLHILTPMNLRKLTFTYWYIPMLEKAVSASKAQFLRLNVLSETRRVIDKKMLKSDHIQRIQFTGPCSFNGALLMPKLKVVEIDCGKDCTGGNIVLPEHAVGKCGLMAASIYHNCPNIKEYAGVSLEDIDPKQDFTKWNNKAKKKFYKEYVQKNKDNGGSAVEFKDWAKTQWFRGRFPAAKKKQE